MYRKCTDDDLSVSKARTNKFDIFWQCTCIVYKLCNISPNVHVVATFLSFFFSHRYFIFNSTLKDAVI